MERHVNMKYLYRCWILWHKSCCLSDGGCLVGFGTADRMTENPNYRRIGKKYNKLLKIERVFDIIKSVSDESCVQCVRRCGITMHCVLDIMLYAVTIFCVLCIMLCAVNTFCVLCMMNCTSCPMYRRIYDTGSIRLSERGWLFLWNNSGTIKREAESEWCCILM